MPVWLPRAIQFANRGLQIAAYVDAPSNLQFLPGITSNTMSG